MIDFYKYSFLSILGKDARTLSEIAYSKELISKYSEYLEKVKKLKEKTNLDEDDNYTEIYL
jgi:hypothetical protein